LHTLLAPQIMVVQARQWHSLITMGTCYGHVCEHNLHQLCCDRVTVKNEGCQTASLQVAGVADVEVQDISDCCLLYRSMNGTHVRTIGYPQRDCQKVPVGISRDP
jgi:hypothetical protein